MDEHGNDPESLDIGRRVSSTQGQFPFSDLEDGEQLLLQVRLMVIAGLRRVPSPAMSAISQLDDETAVDLLRAHCRRFFEEVNRGWPLADDLTLIGALGEELVAKGLRDELQRVGRADLAQQVQRVSLIDDSLGYDIKAPTLGGGTRLIEVKSSVRTPPGTFVFYLSRNEFGVGLKHSGDWALVACAVGRDRNPDHAEIVGWCRAASLRAYLPEDANGRWTEAFVSLPRAVLAPGLPPSV